MTALLFLSVPRKKNRKVSPFLEFSSSYAIFTDVCRPYRLANESSFFWKNSKTRLYFLWAPVYDQRTFKVFTWKISKTKKSCLFFKLLHIISANSPSVATTTLQFEYIQPFSHLCAIAIVFFEYSQKIVGNYFFGKWLLCYDLQIPHKF